MTDFDLHAVTRDVIATRAEWTLDDLTARVFSATPRGAVREAYLTALREFVRQQLAHVDSRPGQVIVDTQSGAAEAGSTPGINHGSRETQGSNADAGPNLARSRVALFRASGFRERVNVGHLWKPLIDCTADELLFAAAENDRHAEANARAADRYRKLAKLLQEYDVATPADLPEDVLREAFSDDRAA